MSDNTQPAVPSAQGPVGMRGEIQLKWGKFGANEIAALKKTRMTWWRRSRRNIPSTEPRRNATSMRSQRGGSSSSCVAVAERRPGHLSRAADRFVLKHLKSRSHRAESTCDD
jgi:hypothetical protein